MKVLGITRCPVHRDFLAIIIEDLQSGLGERVTPSKCCGEWMHVRRWSLTAAEWRDIAVKAEAAAAELDSAIAIKTT